MISVLMFNRIAIDFCFGQYEDLSNFRSDIHLDLYVPACATSPSGKLFCGELRIKYQYFLSKKKSILFRAMLTLKALITTTADGILKFFFFYFLEKISLDIS